MKLKYFILLLISLTTNLFYSQSLSTSLTACYALNGNGTEPINNLTGTLSAVTATVDRFSNANSAIHFNGNAGSFIALPNSPLLKSTNAVSFSAWIKLDNITQSHYIVFAHNTCASYHEGYTLITQNLGPGYKLYVVKSSGACSPATQQLISSTTNLVANTWYHIGGYIGNDSLKVYMNGSLQGTLPITIPFSYNASENVFLGGTGLPFNLPMLGSLDNVRFYNRKLTDGEFNQLYLTDPNCVASVTNPNCNNSFYALSGSSVYESNTGIPNTSTLTGLPLPPGATGLAVGPAFSFPAPNPTYWTTAGGTYWYYNGTNFVNTTHSTGNAGAVNPGGSKNFIYNLVGATGQVYKYNGTGPATLLVTNPFLFQNTGPFDLVGDDLDNFYFLKTQSIPMGMAVLDPNGIMTCSLVVNGITPSPSGGGFAFVGNTVTAHTGANYYVGTISGTTINFTATPNSFPTPSDFANCYANKIFSSTITAAPISSITCSVPTITLSVNSTVTPVNYQWSGPGILTSPNNQTVQVNAPGVYIATLTTGCPPQLSISSFTVANNASPINPTITLTGSISCSSPTAQLSVVPNILTNTYFWSGPGIFGSNITPTLNIIAGGLYSVTITNPVSGCSGTQTINVPTGSTSLTINATASSTQICFPSAAPVSFTATGATNYTWTPVGATLPGTGSVVAANPTVTTTYTISGTSGACTGSTSITISVTPTPTMVAIGSPTVCSGSPTTLSVTGATNYTWMPGSLTGPTVTVSPTVTTNYTITGANGVCTSTTSILLTVVPIPTITASASPTIICQGSTSTLTANGAITYTWQPGNLSGNTVTVSPLATTIYTVSGKNILGCSSSTTIQLVVNNPTISVSPLSNTICTGSSATISASGASSYTWNPGAFTTSSVVVSPTTSTTYTLISINGACTSTSTIPISVAPLPTITAVSNATVICAGGSATLTASGASTYTWNPVALFGSTISVSPTMTTVYVVAGTSSLGCINAGTISVAVNPTPTVFVTGSPTNICSGSPSLLNASGAVTYTWAPIGSNGSTLVVTPSVSTTYTVTGTNSLGCVSSQTVSVLVSPTPTITVSASPTTICNGSSATLTTNGATTYTWMPGALTGTSIVVSPTATTVYTVNGASGICNSTKTFTLVVLPRPTISITAIPPVTCSGNSGALLAFGASSYTWSPGSSVGNTLAITPSVTTTYTVTGTNTVGCANTATTTVTVNPSPTITVITSSNTICSGNSVTLTSSGALNYICLPGAQTGSAIVVSPIVNTTYTISGINGSGCTDTETISITIAPGPTIIATSSNTLLCDGGTFSLSASGATNYTWMPVNLTGSIVSTTASTLINTYTVVGEIGGCTNTATVSVAVISCNNSMFGMTKAAGKPVLVYNSFYNVTFTITAVNASTINLTNVSMDENLSVAFPTPTNFSVVSQPVITSQNSSLSINPLFDGVSQISLTSPSTSTLLANKRDTIVFTVRIDPKGYFGPFKNSVIGFAEFINNVIVSDSSNNGFVWDPDSDGDPTNNDSATVINFNPIDLFIPDGFTPDGDGKNDVFFIKGLNGRPVKLTVFNRWGNKIYENGEYDNVWNAYPNVSNTLGNNKVPQGTYYYIIEFIDGDKETRTGFVVIQY
ncbi:MAG: gliding motility-associated C-terminal domain-containing protein [Bacteroidia bacterium]|nr:gliding motility-associated C-terminal domain-containing protein [Bacteroidia bacterium]